MVGGQLFRKGLNQGLVYSAAENNGHFEMIIDSQLRYMLDWATRSIEHLLSPEIK